MFTGIIEETGTIENTQWGSKSAQIKIRASLVLSDIKTGDSINTNGSCLTVVEFDSDSFTVDVMAETMRRTNLHLLKQGDQVNLERALRLSDRLGGHLVSGHIDDTGTIKSFRREDNAVWITIEAGQETLKYIIYKGSVALDGVSLTVAEASDSNFSVSIIPHTGTETTLLNKKPGDQINIECDMMAKYIEKFTQTQNAASLKSNLNMDYLTKHGFTD